MHKPPVDQDQSSNEYLRVDLVPGDVLFIPRGHIHRGFPGQVGSLHLSVGVHGPTIADGIVAMVRDASLLDDVLRRPLETAQRDEELIETLRTLDGRHTAKVIQDKAKIYLPHSGLTSILRIGSLTSEDVLVRTGGEPLSYRLSQDFATIEVTGLLFDYGVRSEKTARVALPAGYFRALQMINEKSDFTPHMLVQDLGLTTADALELGRKLLTIGVLEYQHC